MGGKRKRGKEGSTKKVPNLWKRCPESLCHWKCPSLKEFTYVTLFLTPEQPDCIFRAFWLVSDFQFSEPRLLKRR